MIARAPTPPVRPKRAAGGGAPKAAAGTPNAAVMVNIHYRPSVPTLRPKAECICAGPNALVIGSRIVGEGSKRGTTCDATLCMACGTIRPIGAAFDHYHHALAHFWTEWGWHMGIGQRLVEFADLSTSSDFESFMALRSGYSPEETRALGMRRSKKRRRR